MINSLMNDMKMKPTKNQNQEMYEQISSGNLKKQIPSTRILEIKSNNQQKESLQTVKQNQQIKGNIIQCRICLQNSTQSDKAFIRPCSCIGSIMYIHQFCFSQWISRTLRIRSNRDLKKTMKQGIQCEVCKSKYPINITSQKAFTNCQKFVEKVSHRPIQFFGMVGFFILSLILFCIVLVIMPKYMQVTDKQPRNNSNHDNFQVLQLEKIIILVSVVVLAVMLGIVLCLIIMEFGFTNRIEFVYKGRQIRSVKGIMLDSVNQNQE